MACVTLDAVVLHNYGKNQRNRAPTWRIQPAPGEEEGRTRVGITSVKIDLGYHVVIPGHRKPQTDEASLPK